MENCCETIDMIVARVIERDEPPQIYGIPIKPTLYQVIQGYALSAMAAVAGKFILGS